MIGLESASSSKPMPLSCARAAARAGPSTSWLELWRGSSVAMAAAKTYAVGRARAAAALPRLVLAALGAAEPRALPLAEAPEVALNLLRVDLAAGQVEVGLGDQAALVALQRHPLGEHVVGVGQAGGAVRARLVRELDAVLVEQLAGLREVGEDRLVGVDQVGVGHAAEVAAGVRGDRAGGLAAPHAEEAEVAVHRPLLLVDAAAQELAGALLRAALAAGVVAAEVVALATGLLAGAVGVVAALEPGEADLPQQGEDDDRRGAEGDDHGPPARATPRRRPRAGRR